MFFTTFQITAYIFSISLIIQFNKMAEELSGVTVVMFIACGILTFILLFIFAKRQIMRFALRSRRGPHIPIGHGAKTSVKREIEHHIEVIPRIVYEPTLLDENASEVLLRNIQNQPSHYCRLKTVSDVKLLEREIAKKDPSLQRCANDNLRSFLLMALMTPMNGSSQKLVHQFCDLYEHARHDPSEFGEEEYQLYSKLLLKLIDIAKLIRSYPNSRKSSPSKTPVKKSFTSELRPRPQKKVEDILQVADKDARPRTLIIPLEDSETSV